LLHAIGADWRSIEQARPPCRPSVRPAAHLPRAGVVAALKDVTSYTIPNWISLALVVAFAPSALASGASLATMGLCLAAGLAALLAGMGMFAAGWIGGGDAKLFAASVLWLGWPAAAPFMLVTAMAGGALTLGLLSLRSGWFEPILAGSPAWVRKLGAKGGDIPTAWPSRSAPWRPFRKAPWLWPPASEGALGPERPAPRVSLSRLCSPPLERRL
jgi:prepilin peptidase CpaA